MQTVVAAAGFAGEFEAWLQLEDLKRFAGEVEAMYAAIGAPRVAKLFSAEPDIAIQLNSRSLGSISGTYRLESERRDGIGTALSGAFELDQSFLPQVGESVHALVRALSEKHAAYPFHERTCSGKLRLPAAAAHVKR